MSYFGDILGFEAFNLKDMGKKLKKDPWRLLVGAGDPLSTGLWNGITGKKMEPLVDQMGGAYGGHTFSAFGSKDGGVYKRAEEAGIDTKAGGQAHDLAHILSAIFGGQALAGLGQGLGGGGGNLGVFSNGGKAGLSGVGGGNAGVLANSGGISGGARGMGGLGNPQQYMKIAQAMNQQPQPAPVVQSAIRGNAQQTPAYLPAAAPIPSSQAARAMEEERQRRRIMEMLA